MEVEGEPTKQGEMVIKHLLAKVLVKIRQKTPANKIDFKFIIGGNCKVSNYIGGG